MPPRSENRRVRLPSGRVIEVHYVEPAAPRRTAGLELCAACLSRRVHPVAWEQVAPEHWQITLRCPDCRSATTGVFDTEIVKRFDDVLGKAAAQAAAELHALERANMREYAERFAAELHAGHVLPEDF